MKKIFVVLFIINVVVISIATWLVKNQSTETKREILKARYAPKHIPPVDHAAFAVLQQDFKTPHDVTRACLGCHTGRGKEMIRTSHWLWSRTEYINGRGVVNLGKRTILNNFCIGIEGSEQSCNRCHVGYGWKDKNFDFTKEVNVDCLVCHDNTGEYVKATGGAGMPDSSVNLSKVAQHVGQTQKANCGACHFFGGGGNNVKHGDLEKALLDCSREVDVHMSGEAADLRCGQCHTTEHHQIKGKLYSVSSMNRDRVSCSQCHSKTPHEEQIINEHTVKVACQSCHIPSYAKVHATKMYWNWQTAGKLKDGKEYSEDDSLGNHTYMSIKGSFAWQRNVIPDYVFFDGTADHYLIGDKVDTTRPININTLNGDYGNPNAQIIPVKIHRAKQIFDTKYNQLIEPKLYSARKGDGGYWNDFDWDTASAIGMRAIGKSYSGHHAFVRTQMSWPVNHMVAPAEQAVSCIECHSKGGRLEKLEGFYLPGRDSDATVQFIGIGAILSSLAGVLIHALLRVLASLKRSKKSSIE